MSRYQRGAAKTAKKVLKKGPSEWREEYDDAFLWRVHRLLMPEETCGLMDHSILKWADLGGKRKYQ